MNNGFTRNVKMNRMYRTPKGTELPILNLRGRDYLEVKYRLVWFREEHPDWSIETEILSATEANAYARATVKDDQGRVIATSHKFETKQGFPDFIEKAETGAIGRALALIGYGTQFCADELDEGDRIVDSPVDHARSPGRPAPPARDERQAPPPRAAESEGQGEAFDADSPPSLEDGDESQAAAAPIPAGSGLAGPDESVAGTDIGSGASPVADASQEQTLRSGQLEPGDYRVSFGKKYKGKRLREIPRREIESYVDWLEASADRKGVPLSDEARFLKMAVHRYLAEGQNRH